MYRFQSTVQLKYLNDCVSRVFNNGNNEISNIFFFLRLSIRNYQRIFAILDNKRVSLMGLLHASFVAK